MTDLFLRVCVFNRPGVAGAVLQTPLSRVTCHVSHVRCHLTQVMFWFFLQRG